TFQIFLRVHFVNHRKICFWVNQRDSNKEGSQDITQAERIPDLQLKRAENISSFCERWLQDLTTHSNELFKV
ncbi:mCG144525, partial [Mus musculus]